MSDPRAPSADELLRRARDLGPLLEQAAPDADARRDLDPQIVGRMREAGLFQMLKPAEWGGFEAHPASYFEVQNALAEHCVSTAWVYGVINVQAFWLARFGRRAQADVWDGPEPGLMSSSFRPNGVAVKEGDGYRLRGQWPFSSGSSHCQWALIGALTPPDRGDGPPQMRLFLVPRGDYQIVDTWRTFGLRGTGSNDLRLDGAFVPAYRTWTPDPGQTVAGAEERPGPALYRLPWGYLFSGSIANLSIGAGRGAIARFRDAGRKRLSAPNATPQATDLAATALARAHAEVEACDFAIKAHCAALMRCAGQGVAMPLDEALLYRSQLTGVTRRITAQVDQLMLLLGARGIDETGPLTRLWLDLCAARHHPGNTPDPAYQQLGGALLAR